MTFKNVIEIMSFPAESTQWLHCALRIKSKLLTMNHRAYTALPKSSGTCGFPWTLTQGLEMPEPAAEKNMMVTFLEFSSSYDCSHHSLIGVLARSLHQFLNPGDRGPLLDHDHDETPNAWARIWPFCVLQE